MQTDQDLENLIAKLPEEPASAYSAFLKFCTLPGTDRTYNKLFPAMAKQFGLDTGTIKDWVREYNWLERASLIDAHDFLVQHQERKEAARRDNEHFLAKNREAKEKAIQLADKMLDTAQRLLADAELAGKVIEDGKVETKDGRIVPTTTTIVMKSKVSDIPRLVEVAVKTTRLAAELPTEIVENKSEMFQTDLSKLTDEELEALRMKNHREIVELGAESAIG